MSTRSYNRTTVRSASPGIGFRSGALRRIVSVLVGCAILGFSVENLIADIHDGDVGAHAETSLSLAGSTEAADIKDPATPDDSNGSGHSAHVCHCIHAHGGILGMSESRVADARHGAQLRGVSDRMPLSIFTEPRVRPPLA